MWHYKQCDKTYLETPNLSGCTPEQAVPPSGGEPSGHTSSPSPTKAAKSQFGLLKLFILMSLLLQPFSLIDIAYYWWNKRMKRAVSMRSMLTTLELEQGSVLL